MIGTRPQLQIIHGCFHDLAVYHTKWGTLPEGEGDGFDGSII